MAQITGTSGNDTLIGGEGNDSLTGLAGNDSLTGGAGNDTLDGGSGSNTVFVKGTADGFYWVANANGEVLLTDAIADPSDPVDGSDEGVDLLRNIQAIAFVSPDGSVSSVTQIDDHSNAPDPGNYQIQYGVWVNGRTNFYGDVDYFKVTTQAGQAVVVSMSSGSSSGYLQQIGWVYPSQELRWVPTVSETRDVWLSASGMNSSSPMSSRGYSFVLRRELMGTNESDPLSAGSAYERLVGGLGDDTLLGSSRSDQLLGEDGNDVMTGGTGSDQIDGGTGTANVAVFSGKRADYSVTWQGQNLALTITDSVAGRDGSDQLVNVQVLRFSDGDVVLDRESNAPVRSGAVDLGRPMTGSLPVSVDQQVDQDYFLQKFPSSVTSKTPLRLTINTIVPTGYYGQIEVRFALQGTTEWLEFSNLGNNSTSRNFNFYFNGSQQQSWIVSPLRVGGSDFVSTGQGLDVLVSGYSYTGSGTYRLGDLVSYTVRLDRVIYGTSGADKIDSLSENWGLAGYIETGLGDDQVQGSTIAEMIVGGAGSDSLSGGDGNDTLQGDSGLDTLFGEGGDDEFVIAGEQTPSDLIDGGAGWDTVVVQSDVNLNSLTLNNVEALRGNGTQRVTVSAAQLASFQSASGVIFGGSNQDLSFLGGDFTLEGTTGSDTLKGGAGNNTFRPFAGNNTVQGGAGDDLVIWERGQGANWDLQYQVSQALSSTVQGSSYVIHGNFDGGAGNDTLEFKVLEGFVNTLGYWDFWYQNPSLKYGVDLSQAVIAGFETLKLTAGMFTQSGVTNTHGPSWVNLSAAQLAGLGTVSGANAVVVGGGTVNLNNVQLLNGATVSVAGDVSYVLTGTAAGESLTSFGGNDSINAGEGQDTISAGAGVDSVNAGAGNDVIIISGKSSVTDTLDGGSDTDTLRVTGADVDLSGATLLGIEKLEANSSSLALTEAQYQQFQGHITGSAGLILKMTSAGSKAVDSLPSGFVGIRGSSGNDNLMGGAGNDLLVGDAGNDLIEGGAGNDRLVAGAGSDTVRGGEGDDIFSVDGTPMPYASFEGGAGTDRLVSSDGLNLSQSVFSSVELLTGSGTVTLSAAQLAQFSTVNGVNVQLSEISRTLSLGQVALAPTTAVMLADYDIQLAGQRGVLGTAQDDTLLGAAGDDRLLGGRGADVLDGGTGNDTLMGGSGADTLRGGDGNDRFVVASSEFQGVNGYVPSDIIDGGDGVDTLAVDFRAANSVTLTLVPGGVSNLEQIELEGGNYSTLSVRADQWRALQKLSVFNTSTDRWSWVTLNITDGGGGSLTLDSIQADSKVKKLNLGGTFGALDLSAFTFGPTSAHNNPNEYAVHVQALDSALLSDGNDALHIYMDGSFSVNAGAGDDRIFIRRAEQATFDGGAGEDVLDVSQAGFIDLTGLTLSNVETINQGNTTILATAEQLAVWKLDGSGAKYTKVDGIIKGTAAGDSYSGSGVETFEGGKGDDYVYFVKTAVFSGRQNDYVFDIATRSNGSSLLVEQSNAGSMLDGRDTLNEVLTIRFGDTPAGRDIVVDDAFNESYRLLSNASARNADFEVRYRKPLDVVKNYSGDTDVYWAKLLPNSPLSITASGQQGSGWGVSFWDVATQQQLTFKSQVYGDQWGVNGEYYPGMLAQHKWVPGFGGGSDFKPYQGGDVVMRVRMDGAVGQEFAFTLDYLDDYRGSLATTGAMDPKVGLVRGYIGDTDETGATIDSDWVRTELVAGTEYRFELRGASSGGGSLLDPLLELHNAQGLKLATGGSPTGSSTGAGTDDLIQFTVTTSGTYYLAASSVAQGSQGSWTLSQQSLDNVLDVPGTTHRVDWNGNQFLLRGEINQLADRDWYRIWLDKGISYSFEALGANQGATLAQAEVLIRSASGNLLALGETNPGKFSHSVSDSGWYILDVGAFGNSGKGAFVIQGKVVPDDFSATPQTTGQLNLGQTLNGLVSYVGDSDWIRVGLSAGVNYVIGLEGDTSANAQLDPLRDPLLLVRDASGAVLGRYDDFGGDLNARAYFKPSASGNYYLEARSAFKYDVGAYALSLSLTPPDDVDPAQPLALALGSSEFRQVGIPGDRDLFKFDLQSGQVYQMTVSGLAGGKGTLVDPFMRVFDASGRLLASNNDGGVGNDAQMYFVPQTSGSYYLEASAANDRGMGTYTVSAVQRDLPADEAAGDVSTSKTLTPGQSFDGRLLTPHDQDWFRISLNAGEDYVLRVRAATSGVGTLQDPVLTVYAADGATVLRSFDNTLISKEPAFAFSPTSSGTYYLAVKAADGENDTGTYRLVTRAPDDHGNTRGQASALSLNQPVAGDLQWADGIFGVRAWDAAGMSTDFDEDWFSFSASQGEVLSVQVTPGLGSGLSRPMVEVVDAVGHTLAIGDGLETDKGQAVATFKAAAAGTLYARIVDGAGATGNYTVTLSRGDASDEDGSAPVALSFSPLAGAQVAQSTARIGLSGDTDTFKLVLQAGHQYRIETLPVRDGSTAPLASATLSLSWLADGQSQAQTVAWAREALSPSSFDATAYTATQSGALSITVAAGDSAMTGQYRLRVVDLGTQVQDDRPDQVKYAADLPALATNGNYSGRIEAMGDVDLFPVVLTPGQIYDFSVKSFADGLGTLAQSQLKLLDAQGSLLTVGQWDGVNGRSDLAVSVFDAGRYYLAVSGVQAAGNLGTYVLDSRQREAAPVNDDIRADAQSGVRVAPGQVAQGAIQHDIDHDWIRATLGANKVYVLDLLAAGQGAGGTLPDGQIRLLDSSGKVLAWDDNSGAGLDAQLKFSASSAGDYFVDVSGSDGSTGSYTLRLRELYSGLADPLASAQWYLGASGLDALGGVYTGAGVKIGMIDDGINTAHPDLQAQINFGAAWDAVGNTPDGMHKLPYPWEFHGTMVAGLMVAERNNETGIVGMAPDATVASLRVGWDWGSITEALGRQSVFDISNNSWGAIQPFSDNFNSTSLTFAWQALRAGVQNGRDGLGTVFVFSAGNSAAKADNTNYHNFQNAREVITVAAANADGSIASFSTPGANVLTSAYGVGLLTTNRIDSGMLFKEFSGTSAAAPMVSGIVALMLEANPLLGYRDVQDILIHASTHPDTQDWKTNGADSANLGGLRFNDQAGFGLVNAANAVRLAQTWTAGLTARNELSASDRAFGLNQAIPDGSDLALTQTFKIEAGIRVEHVELGVDLRHSRMSDLIIELISPNGTVSTLMNRPSATADLPFGVSGIDSGMPVHLNWDFSSVQFWGESAVGDWTVSLRDVRAEQTGLLHSLSLRVYGSADLGKDVYVFNDEGFEAQTTRKLADESGVDTINAAMLSHDVFIDLKANGSVSANTVVYQMEPWSVIEHAVAGSGNDRLDGNAANNWLRGMAGDDTFTGGAGNDTLDGGSGSDTAYFSGNRESYNAPVWNPSTRTITLVGPDGTDVISGMERIRFANGEINLGVTVGNRAPVVESSFFDTPVVVSPGMGIDFDIPDYVFNDPDLPQDPPQDPSDPDSDTDPDKGKSKGKGKEGLKLGLSGESGRNLPEWLSFDSKTGKLTGVPPQDFMGQLKLLITAADEFGETASDLLTLQFGSNRPPVLQAPGERTLDEDAGLRPLGIALPQDPDELAVTVVIDELPARGEVLSGAGLVLKVGDSLSAQQLADLSFRSLADDFGMMGTLRYTAKDADGAQASSSLRVVVTPVNDAPRFNRPSTTLPIVYPLAEAAALEFALPTDPESAISEVTLSELPALGQVLLAGQAVKLGQKLSLSELTQLSYQLNENVRGPVGAVSIRATDPQRLSSDWSLKLEITGTAVSNTGSLGADSLYGSIGADTLYGMAGDDLLVGNGGEDRLLGGLGNDSLFGGSGNDVLDGSSGNDWLDGGTGNDTMTGGPGADTYFVDSSGDVVLEVIGGGAGGKDLVVTQISLTAATNVEHLQAADGFAVNLTGNALDNLLLGNAQANVLLGGEGRDTLFGGAGNDELDGGAGVDKLAGGAGDDTYRVDSRLDAIQELTGEGTDTVWASSHYTLPSNVENLILNEGGDWTGSGNSLANRIVGNAGNNVLAGGLGQDTLDGGLGDDTYVLNDRGDVINDTGGNDTVRTSLDFELPEGIENLMLVGISDASANGNAAANELTGNLGDNILDGGAGLDTLTGGAGSDQFVLARNATGLEADRLTDFVSGVDLLVLDLLSFGIDVQGLGLSSSGTVRPESFVKGAGARPLDPNDYFVIDTAQGVLRFDPDGSGSQPAMDVVKFVGTVDPAFNANDIYVAV